MKIIKSISLVARIGKIFVFSRSDFKKISKAPSTYLEEFFNKFESVLKPNLVDGDFNLEIKSEIIQILESISYKDFNKSIAIEHRKLRIYFRKNERVQILYSLIKEAFRQKPSVLLEIFDQVSKDYESNSVQILTCVEQIQKLEKNLKEEVARGAISVISEIAEPAYKNYLVTISKLYSLVSETEFVNLSGSLGNIERGIKFQLPADYHVLLSSNVSLIRNAKAHGSWSYDAKNEMVIVGNKHKVKEAEYSSFDLKRIAEEMIFNSIHLIPSTLSLIILERYSSDPNLSQETIFSILEELKKDT
ncbi:hypothetical protein [Leptospira santarosai]|uniref:hypothetical protein n=1 Tax=Leptospira santarosai TaxID=28183 RepID=UPI0002972868|nr:hypothetical protein [Leptospira santarosai]EKS06949.1 hypothetical protein LEP1GSC071_0701 [Leptospira santarosai str. JET]MDI7237134.1 hypothetical protein [Leptospira santarosai]